MIASPMEGLLIGESLPVGKRVWGIMIINMLEDAKIFRNQEVCDIQSEKIFAFLNVACDEEKYLKTCNSLYIQSDSEGTARSYRGSIK
jgi:hypothetical protein